MCIQYNARGHAQIVTAQEHRSARLLAAFECAAESVTPVSGYHTRITVRIDFNRHVHALLLRILPSHLLLAASGMDSCAGDAGHRVMAEVPPGAKRWVDQNL